MGTILSNPNSDYGLQIQLLGPPLVQWNDEPLPISRRSVRALLYYLAARGTPVSRGQLCLLFWPDMPEASARRRLTRLLTHLRTELPDPGLLSASEELVALGKGQYRCDAAEFHYRLRGRQPGQADLEAAIALYRGPFLSGFYLAGSPEFEDWTTQERSRLEMLYLQTLDRLIEVYLEGHDFDQAIQAARCYLETDDLAEEIHRKLIGLYGRTGERARALHQYEQCVAVLERELGTDPLPETTATYRAVLEGRPLAARQDEGQAAPSWVGQLRLDIPLVGRGQILSRLEKILAGVINGPSKAILVSGEPGIGKTRLLHALISRSEQRVTVLFGSGERGEMSLPYHPLVEALHGAPNLCPSGLAPAWLSEVARLLPEIGQHKPDLPPPAALSGEEARIRLFDALCRYIASLKDEFGPLLLCLDNLHWFDRTSLDWLVYFCHQSLAKGTKVLLIGTYRSEDAERFNELRGSLSRFGLLDEIQLGGLSQADILELLQVVLGEQPGREVLASRLREATGGNPFFILEILRTLGEENMLSGDLDALEEMPLPDSVREAVDRRLGRLSSRVRQVLEAGAVLGGSFQFNSLRATAGRNEMETANALDALVNRHLLTKDGSAFQFSHDLVRKATAAAISPMRFTLLHGRAGKALERFEPEAEPTIAYHYQLSGAWAKALKFTRRAAENAEALFAWQEAITLYARMLVLVEQIDPEHVKPEMLELCGVIYGKLILLDHNLGEVAKQGERIQQLEQVVAQSESKPLELVLLMLQARYLHLNGHYPEALEEARRGESLAVELEDFGAHARLLAQSGLILYFLGQADQALVKLETARKLADRGDDLELRANVLARLAFVKCLFGKYQEALDCHVEARMCYQQLGNAYFAAQQQTEIGNICASLARFDEAQQALDEILDLARKTRLRYDEGHTLLAMGWLHMCQGEYDEAVQVYSQALEILYTIQNPHLNVVTEIELGTAHYHLGNTAQSLTWLEKGLAEAQKIKFQLRLAEARLVMGMVALANEQQESARGHLEEGLAGARQVQSTELTVVGLLLSADLERQRGDLKGALAYAEEALLLSQGIDLLFCKMWSHTEIGLILLAQGQVQDAYTHTIRAVKLIPQAHQGWIRAEQVRQAHEKVQSALKS